VAWGLLAWAWQRLSWRVVPVSLASVLAAAIWLALVERANLAGEWIIGGIEAKCFAYVLVLLALAELIDGRWNRMWIMLGAATAIHVLVGGWTGIVCGGIWLIERIFREGEAPAEVASITRFSSAGVSPSPTLVAMLPGIIGGAALALIGIVPALALSWHESADVVAAANRIYVFERLPHHLSVLSLPTEEVIQRLRRHAIAIAALLVLMIVNRRLRHESDVGESAFRPHAMDCIAWYACGAAVIAAIGLLLEIALWSHPQLAAPILKFYWFRLTDIAVPMAVAFEAVGLIATLVARRNPWGVAVLAATILFAGGHIANETAHRAQNRLPPTDRQMNDYEAWVDACAWVAENTSPTAVFITPRAAQTFKWRAGRAEVATRKDIPQDARGIVEWSRRVNNLDPPDLAMVGATAVASRQAETARITQLATQYNADYVLTDHRQPLELPVAYWNEEYVIYKVAK
jgi:uncharacterized protein DUF6798